MNEPQGSETSAGTEAAAPPGPHAFTIVTGLSGSGKSLVHRCLEDMGYFCVDNLPISLILKFAELKRRGEQAMGRVALTVDVREREFLKEFPAVLEELRRRHPETTLLFLEADDAALVKRFSETRRPHPLSGAGRTLLEAIAEERLLLAPLRAQADVVVDTTDLTVHEMRRYLFTRFAENGAGEKLKLSVISFGFRNGVPKQADLVFDVRFVPNPHFVDELRPLSGLDAPVRVFLEQQEEYREFVRRLVDLLDFLLPGYEREGKSYLTIAIGCTGGRHRSVAVAEELGKQLSSRGMKAAMSHRDLDRPSS